MCNEKPNNEQMKSPCGDVGNAPVTSFRKRKELLKRPELVSVFGPQVEVLRRVVVLWVSFGRLFTCQLPPHA